MDIFRLPANEYKAVAYLMHTAGRQGRIKIGKTELAEALEISTAQANRMLSSLVRRGVIKRIRRGTYRLLLDTERITSDPSGITSDSPGTGKQVFTVTKVDSRRITGDPLRIISDSSNATDKDVIVGNTCITSNEVIPGAKRETKSKKEKTVSAYIDDTDDLGPVGMPPAPKHRLTPRQKRRRQTQQSFMTSPREDWTMTDAAHFFTTSVEFRRPELLGSINMSEFVPALYTWASDHRMSPQEVAAAIDSFMQNASEVRSLNRSPSPFVHLFQFLKSSPLPADNNGIDTDTAIEMADRRLNG